MGVCKESNLRGYHHKITIEIDPCPGYMNRKPTKSMAAELTLYIPLGVKEIWKGKNFAGSVLSILAYTKPVGTPSGREYPLPVVEDIKAIYTPAEADLIATIDLPGKEQKGNASDNEEEEEEQVAQESR